MREQSVTRPRYTHEQVTRRQRLLAVGACIATATAFVNSCSSEPTPEGCYTTMVDGQTSNNPIEAVKVTLLDKLPEDNLGYYEGINNTANEASKALLDIRTSSDYVMPGDEFTFCVSGDEVRYLPDSAVPSN